MFIRAGTSNYTQPCEQVQEIDMNVHVFQALRLFTIWHFQIMARQLKNCNNIQHSCFRCNFHYIKIPFTYTT